MIDLSIVIPASGDEPTLSTLLPHLHDVLAPLGIAYEIVVVTAAPEKVSGDPGRRPVLRVVAQRSTGYGAALLAGFAEARGDYILTMDADLSHPPTFIPEMWEGRREAEVVVASRYVAGSRTRMPYARRVLSRLLNLAFRRGLSVGIADLSSGFRLYKTSVTRHLSDVSHDYDILPRILVEAYAEGWKVREVPFEYVPHRSGTSSGRGVHLAGAYLRTFWSLWKLRNSILAADYDDRAHDSPIWLQRYWQRNRHRHVTSLVAGEGPVLDVGCGSSRIIAALPPGSVATDILRRKLRHARKFGRALAQASGFALPFRDASFPCVLCSQVIEHVPKESPILDELCRVLAPGGRLVLGTPDYANWQWVWMEKAYGLAAPGGYADEHISHYTYDELRAIFERRGFAFEDARYILKGELIMAFRKKEGAAPSLPR